MPLFKYSQSGTFQEVNRIQSEARFNNIVKRIDREALLSFVEWLTYELSQIDKPFNITSTPYFFGKWKRREAPLLLIYEACGGDEELMDNFLVDMLKAVMIDSPLEWKFTVMWLKDKKGYHTMFWNDSMKKGG